MLKRWSRKACPQTPDPSGVFATIEISIARSRLMSSPKPAANRSRLVPGSSKKTAAARKSPLENAASQTFSYSSSGDFAYRIASLVALNAANVRAKFVSKPFSSRSLQLPSPKRIYAGKTPKWALLGGNKFGVRVNGMPITAPESRENTALSAVRRPNPGGEPAGGRDTPIRARCVARSQEFAVRPLLFRHRFETMRPTTSKTRL